MKHTIGIALTTVAALSTLPVMAQGYVTNPAGVKPAEMSITSPLQGGWLTRAEMMMDEGNYAGVIDQLTKVVITRSQLTDAEHERALYMLARAHYERGDEQCIDLLEEFVGQYPASEYAKQARLIIGDYYFFAHEWGKAYNEYNNVNLGALSGSNRSRYEYRKALSALKCGLIDECKPLFRVLKGNAEYGEVAKFYLAYCDYVQGKLDSAYKGFEQAATSLGNDATASGRNNMKARQEYIPTAPVAEYYMLQIDYARGNYETVIKGGKGIMQKKPVQEFLPEMNRLVGESYFKLGDTNSARPYLQNYVEECDYDPNLSAIYALGVCYYDEGKYDEAETLFEKASSASPQIAQSSFLYLGQIAVKGGDDNTGAMYFRKAYQLNADNDVSQTALYNYIAAASRGGNVPFGSSTAMLQDFLKSYPDSPYAHEVEGYLATSYYNEHDYTKALESINRIKRPDDKILTIKQKILYEAGVEALSNGKNADAEVLLKEAADLSRIDRRIAAESSLWLGDARYNQGNFRGAVSAYDYYLNNTSACANHTLGLYDRAYALYRSGQYKSAVSGFAEALKATPALPTQLRNDARIRLGDCRMHSGDYTGAIADYDQAIADGASEADYAYYRRALLYGVKGDTGRKLKDLEDFNTRYPESPLQAKAALERGTTYISTDKMQQGINALEAIAREWPHSAEARQATLRLALAYSETGNSAKAENAYRTVITRWPDSEEASLANEDLRRIYAYRGELTEYAQFLKGINGAPSLNDNEVERLTFEAAETAYSQDSSATRRLEQYVATYPDGQYLAQALYDLADSAVDRNDTRSALKYADALLARRPDSQQAPSALLIKGKILETTDPATALATYRELLSRGGTDFATEAYVGIMRTATDANESLNAARKVSRASGIDALTRDEAIYYEGVALLNTGNAARGIEILQQLAKNPKSLSGSMSAVKLGEHYVNTGEFTKAEKVLNEMTSSGTSHQYWLARGYIALADAYHGQGKDSLAKEYLNSLEENYPGNETDILNMIYTRNKTWK